MEKELSLEAQKAALAAELKLEMLDAASYIAEDRDKETATKIREIYAKWYRGLTGIHPDDRDEFREALIHVRDGGGVPVKDLIERFNRR